MAGAPPEEPSAWYASSVPDAAKRPVSMNAPEIIVGCDGAVAAAEAVAIAERSGRRTAVWVGEPGDLALVEFRAELGRRA